MAHWIFIASLAVGQFGWAMGIQISGADQYRGRTFALKGNRLVSEEPEFDPRTIEIRLTPDEASEIRGVIKNYAEDYGTWYSIRQRTQGYAPGRPRRIILELDSESGRLAHYEDSEPRLLEKHKGKNRLKVRVAYKIWDAVRVNRKPGGPIQLGPNDNVMSMEPEETIPIYKHPEYSKFPNVLPGEFKNVRSALAQLANGDASALRFAADFGPQQFEGGQPFGRQLIPVIPIHVFAKGQQEKAVFVPIDQINAFRRGEIGIDDLMIIHERLLRHVPNDTEWQQIVDDYLELRKKKEIKEIFVVTPMQKRPQAKPKPQTVETVFLSNMEASNVPSADQLHESLFNAVNRSLNPGEGGTQILPPEQSRELSSEPPPSARKGPWTKFCDATFGKLKRWWTRKK